MNRVQLREALVKRTGRYDLVGTQVISSTNYPDYTSDNGADAFLDSAIRRLDEQIKTRASRRKLTVALTAGDAFVSVPGLRTPVSVQHQITAERPTFLTLIDRCDEESSAYVASLTAGEEGYEDELSLSESPLYYSIDGSGVATVTSVSFSVYVPATDPVATTTAVTVSYLRTTGSATHLVDNVVLTSTDGHTYTYTYAAAELGTTYIAYILVEQTISGDDFSLTYDVRSKADDTGIGLRLWPAATLGGSIIVDGWFYTTFGAGDTTTCFWTLLHPDLVLSMATLELGIALSDENVGLVAKRLEDIKRSLISDDISTEVEALGCKARLRTR